MPPTAAVAALPTTVAASPRSADGQTHCWALGELMVSHGEHAAAGPPPQGAELLLPQGQPLFLHRPGMEPIQLPPLDLLYLPAQAAGIRRSAFHGWRLMLDPRRLSLLASDLSGHHLQPGLALQHLSQLQTLQPENDDSGRRLKASLQQLLELCDSHDAAGRRQLERVGLERCLLGLLATVLFGKRLEAPPCPPVRAQDSRERCFEDLLAWIRANLHRRIRLEELERQSSYSQRSLRNFFQERFQCGPVQWIRQQRLERARGLLLEAQRGDTVSQIASDSGYGNLAQFSRDFQRAFQIRPSQLLREALRAQRAGDVAMGRNPLGTTTVD